MTIMFIEMIGNAKRRISGVRERVFCRSLREGITYLSKQVFSEGGM